jgi:sugar phosphate isomerase/epimerase
MNVRTWQLPFRVGATSYIIDADLVANADFLAPHVQDMQLVLFDLPGGPSNLPDAATVTRLAEIGARGDLSYTVHLIDDLADWDAPPHPVAPPPALCSAQDVIARTQALSPWAWVAHLDGRNVRAQGYPAAALAAWRVQIAAIVTSVGRAAGDEARLAIENLEGYPPAFITPVVAATAASRCVDIGHLWLDGHDPLEHLLLAWPRLRVVHLHGVSADVAEAHRDHRSLALMPPPQLDRVVHLLLARRYTGVLTLEIFGETDFWSSLHALEASVQRYRGKQANAE